MKNDTDLTKLTRWLIPGWLAILAFYVFVSTDILTSLALGQKMYPDISDFLDSMSGTNTLITAILVATAGVPAGFVIYQLYYFMRWNSAFSRDGLFVPLVAGRMRELKRMTRDLGDGQLALGDEWRLNLILNPLYSRDHAFQFRYKMHLFMEASQAIDLVNGPVSYYQRHSYLHEVTHTLGASTVALYVAFIAYLVLRYAKGLAHLGFAFFIFVLANLILFALVNAENRAREALDVAATSTDSNPSPIPAFSLRRPFALAVASPDSLLCFGLMVFTFFMHPNLNPSHDLQHLLWQLALVVAVGIIWVTSKPKEDRDLRWGDSLILGATILASAVATRYSSAVVPLIDWSYFSTLQVFLVSTLILVKNRKNANDDLLAIEYYVLQRYLTRPSK